MMSIVTLSADQYPRLQRNPEFAAVSETDLNTFHSLLPGPERVITDAADLEGYNTDWQQKFRGQSQVVLRPKTTEEVSAVMKHCYERGLAVVPQGGNTGLVGGSVPVFDEVVISLALMNKVLDFDPISGILVCESGCILEHLDNELAKQGFMMPLDLGAKGSCHIGGNVSTNAGGLRLVRYGSLHGTVMGLEVVLPDGTIMSTLSKLRKDNTGYDLKQLFIGAEGTLGIVTAVSILTPPKPNAVNVALVACESYEKVIETSRAAKRELSEVLSALEFFDVRCKRLVEEQLGFANPIAGEHPFYVLLETSGSNSDHDEEKLGSFLQDAMEAGRVLDGVIAQDDTQIGNIWRLRESIATALKHAGKVYKYDVSIPVPVLYDLVEDMRLKTEGKADVLGYGHLGDGNLHLNFSAPEYSEELVGLIEPYVYEWTSGHAGSISAEHGLGLQKANCMHYSKPKEAVEVMQKIKDLFDPKGIMNPYKTLPWPDN